MLCQIVFFFFGSLLILLSQGWSSFPFRCGSTVIGPDSGAARESQQALWSGWQVPTLPTDTADCSRDFCISHNHVPAYCRQLDSNQYFSTTKAKTAADCIMSAYGGLGFTPNRTSRLDWPAFRRWDRQSFALRPRWWMKQDSNLRTRSFHHGAESAQLLHPS